jgi:hypothetical protein
MHVSHETIDLSLFIQARDGLETPHGHLTNQEIGLGGRNDRWCHRQLGTAISRQ